MEITQLEIPDVILITPDVFGDERGFFFESFNQKKFEEAVGRKVEFVQDNHSKSVKGVLRGLHYQLPPHAQGKLVRVVQGEVFDVAVDIRKSSQHSENGWEKCFRQKIKNSFGYQKALHMGFLPVQVG